jgi:cytochrome P450
MAAADLLYDPYDYAIDADPYPVWRRLRDEAPLYWNEQHGFYALSRYDDVLDGLLETDTFLSSHGIVLEMITDQVWDIPMMIMMDPPGHTRLRKLVSRAFTPRRIADLEGRIRALCVELLDAVEGQDEFDYIDTFAGMLPPTVILSLLGFPEGHARQFRELADASLHVEEGETMQGGSLDRERYLVAENGEIGNEAFAILPELLEERRRDPKDDLISGLVHAEIEDGGETRRLTLEEIVAFVQLIGSAGTETVARLLGFAAVTLARYPDQRQLLVDQPELATNAVEELLRYEAPSPIQSRYVARDFERHGTVIPAGSRISLLNGSADRDERHFEEPDTFDVRRVIDRHLAFGYGTHFCIGAALARLEGKVALEETLRRYPTWEIDESRIDRVHTATVRGYSSVPMRVR